MSFEMRRFSNDMEVREGAEITDIVSSQPVLGRRPKAGAVCEGLRPETWRSIITVEGRQVVDVDGDLRLLRGSEPAAREHVDRSLDRAVRGLFA